MGASKGIERPPRGGAAHARSEGGAPGTRSGDNGATRKAGLLSVPPVVRGTVAVVASFAACLTALSVGALVYRFEIDPAPHRYLMRLFNLDDEGGFQAWYQSSTLLACAVLLGAIAARRRQMRSPFALHWATLSGIFVAASADEVLSLHEQAIEPLRDWLNAGGLLYFTWVVPAAGILVVLAAAYWRLLAHLPPRILKIFLLAAALYLGGAMGVEALGGLYADHQGGTDLTYALITNVEEVLEMAGVLAFGAALGTYLIEHSGEPASGTSNSRRPGERASEPLSVTDQANGTT